MAVTGVYTRRQFFTVFPNNITMLRQLTFLVISIIVAYGASAARRPGHNRRTPTLTHVRSAKPTDKIVGGTDADIADYPYQLSFQVYGSHACGASVIDSNWALTAAHCCDGMSPSSLSLRAGSSYRGSSGTVHAVKKIVQHESYNPWIVDYDICLLEVSNEFDLTSANIKAVQLPESNTTVAEGSNATITGWGETREDGSLPVVLQMAIVPIVSEAACQREYGADEFTARMICAGYAEGKIDACQGDSGGPLVFNNEQIGVTSWGIGCARPNKPGVYAKVSELRSWIMENSGV